MDTRARERRKSSAVIVKIPVHGSHSDPGNREISAVVYFLYNLKIGISGVSGDFEPSVFSL